MMENKNALIEAAEPAASLLPAIIVELPRPFMFEGQQYTQIDLSGLRDLTAKEAGQIDEMVILRMDPDLNPAVYTDPDYYRCLAYMASGIPIEAFRSMPLKSMRAVRSALSEYLDGDLEEPLDPNNLVVPLIDPFELKGEAVTELDLTALEDLTGDQLDAIGVRAKKLPGAKPFLGLNALAQYQQYQLMVAAKALGVSALDFMPMSMRDILRVRAVVATFFGVCGLIDFREGLRDPDAIPYHEMMKRLCIRLSQSLYGGYLEYMSMSIDSILDLAVVVADINEQDRKAFEEEQKRAEAKARSRIKKS